MKQLILSLLVITSIYSCKKQDSCYRYEFSGKGVTMSDLFSHQLDSNEIEMYVYHHKHILGDSPTVKFDGIENCPR